ncbi:MAG: C39 family peptidase [Candidatus Moraniibacteriota bacterium]
MQKKIKKQPHKFSSLGLFSLVVLAFLVMAFSRASAEDLVSEANQDKLDELNDKAAVYRQIINIKKKQSETLDNKISSMTSTIKDVQGQIKEAENQIDGLNSEIGSLESQIANKKNQIASEEKILGKVIQAYYQITQTSPVAIYLAEDNIASFMVNKDRVSQTGDKIREMIENLNQLKAGIEEQNQQLNSKKGNLVDAHQDLQSKHDNFQSIKKQQTILLAQTQSEEEKYSELLKNVQEQKEQLLNLTTLAGASFSLDGLSVEEYLKKHQPSSSLFASTSWYFSQKDSRWGSMTIGKTKTLMSDYGCAVTSVAMVFKNHGGSITPGGLAKQPIFSGDLINWPSPWDKPKLEISSEGKSHKNINWSTVDSEIKKDNPVIVYIGRSNGSGGHYVVVHHKASGSDYVVHDPYFGANILLSSSRALIGAMGSSSSTYIDQMIVYN